MRFDKLRKQLELLALLSDGRNYTVEELCERMDIRTIYSLLTMADNGSSVAVNQLRRKIENAYALSVSAPSLVRRQMNSNLSVLRQAMERKRMVRLVGYSSPNSHTVKDRIVEPFLLLHDNEDVRCHELLSHTNKTFKISRMKDVEELDTPWLHEDRHRQVFTDIFMFSGEECHRVKLRLGQLSHNLFVEEYPQGVRYVARQEDSSWLLDIEVCDYRGLGRFVLGLYKDIDIVEGEGFMAYMQEEIESLTQKASPPAFFRKASPPAPLRVERGVNSGLPL